MLGSSWATAQLAASQVGLSSMSEWVSENWVLSTYLEQVRYGFTSIHVYSYLYIPIGIYFTGAPRLNRLSSRLNFLFMDMFTRKVSYKFPKLPTPLSRMLNNIHNVLRCESLKNCTVIDKGKRINYCSSVKQNGVVHWNWRRGTTPQVLQLRYYWSRKSWEKYDVRKWVGFSWLGDLWRSLWIR
jgi:hypothetical protein